MQNKQKFLLDEKDLTRQAKIKLVAFGYIFVIFGLFMGVLGFSESASAQVIFEDDFDGYSDEPSNHGWVQYPGTKVNIIQDGYLGRGVRCTFDTAGSDGGNYTFARRVSSYSRSDLYVRFYFRLIDPTHAGTNQAYEGGCKFNKWFGINSDTEGYANTTNGLQFSTPPHLGEIGSGKGNSIYNDSQAPFKYIWSTDPNNPLRNYELSPGNYIDFVQEDGVWHCMEMRIKFNSNDQRDGLIQQWMDGVEILRVTNVKNRHDNNSLYWGSINWFDYTHINTHTWYMDIDNIVISDEYIGSIDAPDTTPPHRSDPQPTGILTSGTTQTTISLTTNETATCKYSETSNTAYDPTPNTFSTTSSTSHSQLITNLSDGNTYTYYIRCQDTATPPNQNTDDFTISFNIANPCTESWTCTEYSDWSSCIDSQQTRTRTCTDENSCGTEIAKPDEIETQACSQTYGISHFAQLIIDWLKSMASPFYSVDLNEDGIVNTRDLGIMMSNWEE